MEVQKTDALTGLAISVQGTVQGVGFRPFVWRLAHALGVRGEVSNNGAGVIIKAWAPDAVLKEFIQRIALNDLPLARIANISTTPINEQHLAGDFQIVESTADRISTAVSVDAATCLDCLKELNDPDNRRHQYPFINCTNCGPRLTILKSLPYDRSKTSMSEFELCASCLQEYKNPCDRRFHAEPNACSLCGPHLFVMPPANLQNPDQEVIELVVQQIKQGKIVALKGLGGFHLICDATDFDSVAQLRKRKHRFKKPLALMANGIAMIERYCTLCPEERALLLSPKAPVLVLALTELKDLSPSLAPEQGTLAFMLPYTPLHHLIMQHLDNPIVCTSGNISEEPQCISNDDAQERLTSVADFFVMHDREIVNRVDDTVMRFISSKPRMLRRARGFSPEPFSLPFELNNDVQILAMGAELKNTFCLIKDGNAILSQHIGDLKDSSTFDDYLKNIDLHQALYEHTASDIVVDKHPEYMSTKLGSSLASKYGATIHFVQHHHAHIAACLLENAWNLSDGPVLGIVFDGIGLGDDDTFWGGEFLLADYSDFKRLAMLKPVQLLGGSQAMKEPWRNTYAHVRAFMEWDEFKREFSDLAITNLLESKPLKTLDSMLASNTNVPLASSAGRLFDAVAAALGICPELADYEGQAAIELESIASPHQEASPYQFGIGKNASNGLLQIDSAPMWLALLQDLKHNVPAASISSRFHNGLACIVVELAMQLIEEFQPGLRTVAISGGVFQNKLLFEEVCRLFDEKQLHVMTPYMVPANDGGISFGQAAVCAARLRSRQLWT